MRGADAPAITIYSTFSAPPTLAWDTPSIACSLLEMPRHLDDDLVVPMDHSLRCLIGELLAAKSAGELERVLNTIRAQGDCPGYFARPRRCP
jgi:hypothetical protein